MKKTVKKTTKTIKKTKKSVKTSNTVKQKKFVKIFTDNLGTKGKTKTLMSMLLEAGYSEESARQQTNTMKGIVNNKDFKDKVEWIKQHQEKIMERMDKKIDKAEYNELTRAMHVLDNILLLAQGKPTQNIRVLSDEEKAELDEIYEENS